MSSPLENLLSRLKGVQLGQENHSARCPAHPDRQASLSVREGNDGRVLLYCHAGCDWRDILKEVGLSGSDLFPGSKSNGVKDSSGPFTLEELSRQRRLPVDFLRSLDIMESGRYIRIPYRQTDGTEARPQLRARDGEQKWADPKGLPIVPYGLDRLDTDEVCLVEGASDCWTLWHAGCPALGIPGANMHRKLEAEHIRGLSRIHLVREADDGGKTFERNIRTRLNTLGFRGEVFVVSMEELGAGDPSDLYTSDTVNFPSTWQKALDDAKPLTLDDPDEVGGQETRTTRVLVAKSLNDWLSGVASEPRARCLYGELWFEGELCILFGETNTGKSILAIQISQALASGHPALPGFEVDVPSGKVLYYDFELSPRQILGRYSDEHGNRHAFHPNLIRAEVRRDFDFKGAWKQALSDDIERLIVEHEPRVVVLDNLTAIRDDTEKAKGALPLMRLLNTLKRRYDLSMLSLAHTPKRDQSRPISRNDLAGSRNILNLTDSCFAIGESHRDVGTRYLKQIKVREADFSFDTENVALLSLDKTGSFLGFSFLGYGSEIDHLKVRTSAEKSELDAQIIDLVGSRPDLSYREVATRLGTNHRKVGRTIKRHEEGGILSGTGGTSVPVSHPPKQNRIKGRSVAGTVGQVSQGVPLNGNGVIAEDVFPWTEKHGEA